MMDQSTRTNIWTAAAASAFPMITSGIAQQVSAAPPEHLNHKEVKELIATAKGPQDHLPLAHYYDAEADRLEATANKHDEMAEAYRKNTTSEAAAMKNPAGPSTVAHCEFFVKSMRDTIKADRELPQEHKQMAKDATAAAKY